MVWRIHDYARAPHVRGIAALSSLLLGFGIPCAVSAQSSYAASEVGRELHFPARSPHKHPEAVRQQYDAMMDLTKLRLGLESGNPISLVWKPIVQLDLEATFSGARPHSSPDSVVVTSRVFQLRIFESQGRPQAVERSASGGAGPMLSFLVGDAGNPAAGQPWRTSLASVVTGSKEVLRADDTGIYFRGNRWLSAVANFFDLRKKPGELSLALYARADTGHLAMDMLPEGVKEVLHQGFSLSISEEAHRLAIPLPVLLQLANAPGGIRTRFGTLDFAIDGDQLDALRDFASRLAPDGATSGPSVNDVAARPLIGSAGAPSTVRDDAPSLRGTIPSGTVIELANSYSACAKALKPGRNHLATVTRAVNGGTSAVVPAEATVLLVVREVHVDDAAIDSTRIAMDVSLLAFDGKSYPLKADVTEMKLEPSAGHDVCIPKDGRIIIRLRSPLALEP